jgi:6-phosphogluconolactonase
MRQILIRENAADLATLAADRLVEIAGSSIAARGEFSIALSGGTTPKVLYKLLAAEYGDLLDWKCVRFFFGDERNVPPSSSESNYRMAKEAILDPLRIDELRVTRWRTELGTSEAAAEYHDHLKRNGPLDLVLLGLGSDAHTASLFPNTDALSETERLAVANWVEKLGDFRLTMTFPAINRARHVMFLVAGREKAEAVRTVLEGEFRPDDDPAQMVQPETGELDWLLDRAAAALVGPVQP